MDRKQVDRGSEPKFETSLRLTGRVQDLLVSVFDETLHTGAFGRFVHDNVVS